ncbi:MAG: DUF1844 domain-containing protein [candidate division Zixibacteria bacterium]|nr:DUF1844 domain-containing protein [candidate division Zixibacteria bacterium]
MTNEDDLDKTLFSQMILSLQMGAMQQMGKFASPMTGKIERDMVMAKASIDMLAMLEKKSKGNLTEDEDKLIGHALYELRINFVDESKKSDQPTETATSDSNNSGAEASDSESDETSTEPEKS